MLLAKIWGMDFSVERAIRLCKITSAGADVSIGYAMLANQPFMAIRNLILWLPPSRIYDPVSLRSSPFRGCEV
jgi:hypothetical protein